MSQSSWQQRAAHREVPEPAPETLNPARVTGLGARHAGGREVAVPLAARTPEQGLRPGRAAAGDSLRRAAIANSQAPRSKAAGGGGDLPAGKGLGAHLRAATASEGCEGPQSSSASSCISISGGRSKTLPAAASPARYALHARAVPGPPWSSAQDSITGDTRTCKAAISDEAVAESGASTQACGAGCGDVEAQSGGRQFLHRLPTPFSAAAPAAASPRGLRGEPSAPDQRSQTRGRSGSLGDAALPRFWVSDPKFAKP